MRLFCYQHIFWFRQTRSSCTRKKYSRFSLRYVTVQRSNNASQQGTGFCNTYSQFLACRALFGVAMGGLYGNAAATALEDCPEEARGLMSGILQQGVS